MQFYKNKFYSSVQRLIDKGGHGESLTDLESLTLYFSIAATPLHFISSLANAKLATGAAQGKVFTSSTRVLATLLNISTIGIDGALMALGLANLINKAKAGQVSTLDVLQFSMSIFFFANTLVQPKTVGQIIKEAQRQRIQEISNSMRDADAQMAFQDYLQKNAGSMHKDAEVIKTLTLIKNLNEFFANVPNGPVTGAQNEYQHQKPAKVNKVGKLNKSLGVDNYEKFQIDGKDIFQNMDDRTKGRINKVFGGAAGYDRDVVSTAEGLAKTLGATDANKFMSLVEVIAADTKGMSSVARCQLVIKYSIFLVNFNCTILPKFW